MTPNRTTRTKIYAVTRKLEDAPAAARRDLTAAMTNLETRRSLRRSAMVGMAIAVLAAILKS